MIPQSKLERLRELLAQKWLLALFGSIFLVSQVVIAIVLHPLGTHTMVGLQVTGFTAEIYRATFAAWEAAGTMPFYHAHFVFDNVHPVWYSIALSVCLALGLDAARLSDRWNIVILFPLVAGILDVIENGLQQVFLSHPQYLTMIDPLPAISTVASIGKWSLALPSIVLIVWFYLRARNLANQPAGQPE